MRHRRRHQHPATPEELLCDGSDYPYSYDDSDSSCSPSSSFSDSISNSLSSNKSCTTTTTSGNYVEETANNTDDEDDDDLIIIEPEMPVITIDGDDDNANSSDGPPEATVESDPENMAGSNEDTGSVSLNSDSLNFANFDDSKHASNLSSFRPSFSNNLPSYNGIEPSVESVKRLDLYRFAQYAPSPTTSTSSSHDYAYDPLNRDDTSSRVTDPTISSSTNSPDDDDSSGLDEIGDTLSGCLIDSANSDSADDTNELLSSIESGQRHRSVSPYFERNDHREKSFEHSAQPIPIETDDSMPSDKVLPNVDEPMVTQSEPTHSANQLDNTPCSSAQQEEVPDPPVISLRECSIIVSSDSSSNSGSRRNDDHPTDISSEPQLSTTMEESPQPSLQAIVPTLPITETVPHDLTAMEVDPDVQPEDNLSNKSETIDLAKPATTPTINHRPTTSVEDMLEQICDEMQQSRKLLSTIPKCKENGPIVDEPMEASTSVSEISTPPVNDKEVISDLREITADVQNPTPVIESKTSSKPKPPTPYSKMNGHENSAQDLDSDEPTKKSDSSKNLNGLISGGKSPRRQNGLKNTVGIAAQANGIPTADQGLNENQIPQTEIKKTETKDAIITVDITSLPSPVAVEPKTTNSNEQVVISPAARFKDEAEELARLQLIADLETDESLSIVITKKSFDSITNHIPDPERVEVVEQHLLDLGKKEEVQSKPLSNSTSNGDIIELNHIFEEEMAEPASVLSNDLKVSVGQDTSLSPRTLPKSPKNERKIKSLENIVSKLKETNKQNEPKPAELTANHIHDAPVPMETRKRRESKIRSISSDSEHQLKPTETKYFLRNRSPVLNHLRVSISSDAADETTRDHSPSKRHQATDSNTKMKSPEPQCRRGSRSSRDSSSEGPSSSKTIQLRRTSRGRDFKSEQPSESQQEMYVATITERRSYRSASVYESSNSVAKQINGRSSKVENKRHSTSSISNDTRFNYESSLTSVNHFDQLRYHGPSRRFSPKIDHVARITTVYPCSIADQKLAQRNAVQNQLSPKPNESKPEFSPNCMRLREILVNNVDVSTASISSLDITQTNKSSSDNVALYTTPDLLRDIAHNTTISNSKQTDCKSPSALPAYTSKVLLQNPTKNIPKETHTVGTSKTVPIQVPLIVITPSPCSILQSACHPPAFGDDHSKLRTSLNVPVPNDSRVQRASIVPISIQEKHSEALNLSVVTPTKTDSLNDSTSPGSIFSTSPDVIPTLQLEQLTPLRTSTTGRRTKPSKVQRCKKLSEIPIEFGSLPGLDNIALGEHIKNIAVGDLTVSIKCVKPLSKPVSEPTIVHVKNKLYDDSKTTDDKEKDPTTNHVLLPAKSPVGSIDDNHTDKSKKEQRPKPAESLKPVKEASLPRRVTPARRAKLSAYEKEQIDKLKEIEKMQEATDKKRSSVCRASDTKVSVDSDSTPSTPPTGEKPRGKRGRKPRHLVEEELSIQLPDTVDVNQSKGGDISPVRKNKRIYTAMDEPKSNATNVDTRKSTESVKSDTERSTIFSPKKAFLKEDLYKSQENSYDPMKTFITREITSPTFTNGHSHYTPKTTFDELKHMSPLEKKKKECKCETYRDRLLNRLQKFNNRFPSVKDKEADDDLSIDITDNIPIHYEETRTMYLKIKKLYFTRFVTFMQSFVQRRYLELMKDNLDEISHEEMLTPDEHMFDNITNWYQALNAELKCTSSYASYAIYFKNFDKFLKWWEMKFPGFQENADSIARSFIESEDSISSDGNSNSREQDDLIMADCSRPPYGTTFNNILSPLATRTPSEFSSYSQNQTEFSVQSCGSTSSTFDDPAANLMASLYDRLKPLEDKSHFKNCDGDRSPGAPTDKLDDTDFVETPENHTPTTSDEENIPNGRANFDSNSSSADSFIRDERDDMAIFPTMNNIDTHSEFSLDSLPMLPMEIKCIAPTMTFTDQLRQVQFIGSDFDKTGDDVISALVSDETRSSLYDDEANCFPELPDTNTETYYVQQFIREYALENTADPYLGRSYLESSLSSDDQQYDLDGTPLNRIVKPDDTCAPLKEILDPMRIVKKDEIGTNISDNIHDNATPNPFTSLPVNVFDDLATNNVICGMPDASNFMYEEDVFTYTYYMSVDIDSPIHENKENKVQQNQQNGNEKIRKPEKEAPLSADDSITAGKQVLVCDPSERVGFSIDDIIQFDPDGETPTASTENGDIQQLEQVSNSPPEADQLNVESNDQPTSNEFPFKEPKPVSIKQSKPTISSKPVGPNPDDLTPEHPTPIDGCEDHESNKRKSTYNLVGVSAKKAKRHVDIPISFDSQLVRDIIAAHSDKNVTIENNNHYEMPMSNGICGTSEDHIFEMNGIHSDHIEIMINIPQADIQMVACKPLKKSGAGKLKIDKTGHAPAGTKRRGRPRKNPRIPDAQATRAVEEANRKWRTDMQFNRLNGTHNDGT